MECIAAGNATTRKAALPFGGTFTARRGLITMTLIGLNVGFYLLTALTSPTGLLNNNASHFFAKLALVPNFIAIDHEYQRLVGSAFLHIGLLHLAANMVTLAVIGPNLEHVLGRWRFLAVYLISALGGSVAIYVFGNPLNATVGASGAIFGLIGATLLVTRKLGLDTSAVIGLIAVNVLITFTIPGISKQGHLGGLAFGLLTTALIIFTPAGRWRTVLQVAGCIVLLVVLTGFFIYRTQVLGGTV